ncbi:Helicase associated domain protein [Dactylosporangium sp. CA-233914]|uniref:helicase associated domain-containing protein n=1 Tax=Dactylosporangium sp. CA-233914 TaxID=3239934 RepID=UPI003D8DA717
MGAGRGLPGLRGYQADAVAAIVAGLAGGSRGQLIAACGSGKTLVAAHAAVRLVPAGLVVIACPSLALVAQTLAVWSTGGAAGDVLAVCSDDSVADASMHASELDCPVTTDPDVIAAWLRQGVGGGLRLMLTTHQSAGTAGRGLAAARVIAELLVVDEAHRTAGRAGKHGALVHHDASLPARRRLYLTATPRMLSPRRNARTTDDIVSMDDATIFGERLYSYPFARAIDEGWLDDYRVLVVGVTRTEVLTLLQGMSGDTVVGSHQAPLRTAVVQTALAGAAVEFGLRRIMVFCPRVEDSAEFTRTLRGTVSALPEDRRPKGHLTPVHVDGTQNAAQRRIALAALADPPQSGWTVLSNVRCLAEGVDVPAVDAVTFTHPKHSEADIIQAVGRALRRNPEGSGIATILVPVLLPDDPDHIPDNLDEWTTLCKIVQALRAHDHALAADLDTQRTTLAAGGPATLPPRVVMRLPDGYDLQNVLHHITVRVLEHSTSDWLVGYAALQAFQQRHGHTRAPVGHREQGVNVDRWIKHQRTLQNKGRLLPERYTALCALGLEFDVFEADWQRMFAAVQAFHAEHGHLAVPEDFRPDGINASGWLTRQRTQQKRGKLAPHRVELLERLGIVWDPNASWDDGLAATRVFYAEHGHLNMAPGTTVNDINVYHWLSCRRIELAAGRLADSTKATLDAMGMVWSLREQQWWKRFAAVRRYAERTGNTQPPRTLREDGVNLSVFLSRLHSDHQAGRLAADQIAAAEAIGIRWNTTGTGTDPEDSA